MQGIHREEAMSEQWWEQKKAAAYAERKQAIADTVAFCNANATGKVEPRVWMAAYQRVYAAFARFGEAEVDAQKMIQEGRDAVTPPARELFDKVTTYARRVTGFWSDRSRSSM